MSAILDLSTGEEVLKSLPCQWMKSKMNMRQGKLYLTSKRLVFVQDANPFAGLLLKLFVKKTNAHAAVDVNLKDIKSISNENLGFVKGAMLVNYGDQSTHFALHKDCDNWIEAVKKAKN